MSAQKVARALCQAGGRDSFFEVSLQKTLKSCIDQVALFWHGSCWMGSNLWLSTYRLVEWVDIKVRAQLCVWMISIFGLTYSAFYLVVEPGIRIQYLFT